jgi:predicted flavoprotein YhiN
MNPQFDVVVVGAGAAGMMAAIAAAQRAKLAGRAGCAVAICEHLDRPGVKLLATGGGRCNLASAVEEADFLASFGRQGRFLAPAMKAMGRDALLDFFRQLGVETCCPDGLRIYPASNLAKTVQSALWQRCQELGIRAMMGADVTGLLLEDKSEAQTHTGGPASARAATMPATQRRVAGVRTSDGDVPARAVVIATGGRSYPELGATGGGYELARQAGHSITDLTPALVGLVTRERELAACAGVSLRGARVWIDRKGAAKAGRTGDVLLTHRGISGPAVLDLSGDVAQLLRAGEPVPIRLAIFPATPARDWPAKFDLWQHDHGAKLAISAVSELMPYSLSRVLCGLAGVAEDLPCAHLNRHHREGLAELLTALPLTVTDTEGFEAAMITRGGVRLKEVDPATLASRLCGGLYFAGELLDLDGPSGGFNLQMAFATGYLAGESSIAEFVFRNSDLPAGQAG